MQLGAFYAGAAIENSMLGATHACANPLTARYGTAHGAAIAMLLPSVVRWNASVASERYAELLNLAGSNAPPDKPDAAEMLAQRLEQLAAAGGLLTTLSAAGVSHDQLGPLAEDAATQWTGGFNPRAFDATGALEIYEFAF
jgi:alcohol dehydrogenase